MLKSKTRVLQLLIVLVMACLGIVWIILPASSQDVPTPILIESDDARIEREGNWYVQSAERASGGSYLFNTGGRLDVLTLHFEGSRVEIRYVEHPELDAFAIEIDNVVVRTVSTKSETTSFEKSAVIDYLDAGPHVLRVYAVDGTVGIDAFVAAPVSDAELRLPEAAVGAECSLYAPLDLVRASVNNQGVAANHDARYPSLSADGTIVVFESLANNLVPNDTNGMIDVFVRDLVQQVTTRISVANDGSQSNGHSAVGYPGGISWDGRYVVFASEASNLVANDTNGTYDIFVYDRQTGQNTRVSLTSSGAEATTGNANSPSISGDGRYVTFATLGALVSDDTNARYDIYVHDRLTLETSRVSLTAGGAQPNNHSVRPQITSDGRFVAFYSIAALVLPDSNNRYDTFVRDRQLGQTQIISVTPGGQVGDGDSTSATITDDGRYVMFISEASNLEPGSPLGVARLYRRDRQMGQTIPLSQGSSNYPQVSSDGRYVTFGASSNQTVSDGISQGGTYVFDLVTGQRLRTSNTASGEQPGSPGTSPALTEDGSVAAFTAEINGIICGENSEREDVFVLQVASLFRLDLQTGSGVPAQLSWNDLFTDETEFRVERFNNNVWNQIAVVPANQTSYTDSSVTCLGGTYRVRAYRGSDGLFSAYSQAERAFLPACATATPTSTRTPTATRTPSITATSSITRTTTPTRTITPTFSGSETITPTITPTPTRTPLNTETPTPTRTITPTRTATPTATSTPHCAGFTVENIAVAGVYFQITVRNTNPGSVWLLGATVFWRPWISPMAAMSAGIVGQNVHWAGPDFDSPTVISHTGQSTTREFRSNVSTVWRVRFVNGPADLAAAGYTIYDFAGSTLTLGTASQSCIVNLNLTAPTPTSIAATSTPPASCAALSMTFDRFETNSVLFAITNNGPAGLLTGFTLNWIQYHNTMTLISVSVEQTGIQDSTDLDLWSGDDRPPSSSIEGSWLTSAYVDANHTIKLKFHISGVSIENYLPIAGHFNGSSVTVSGCNVLFETTEATYTPAPPTPQFATFTPSPSFTVTFTPSSTYTPSSTASVTPTVTQTSIASPTASPTNTPTTTPTASATSTSLPPPNSVTPISPINAAVTSRQPLFKWNALAGAQWYRVWIQMPNGTTALDQWVQIGSGVICDGSQICTFQPASPLGNSVGSTALQWSIQAYGTSFGMGPLAGPFAFTITAPTLLEPNGSIGQGYPTFRWTHNADATLYQVYVGGPNGSITEWVNASQKCSGNICSSTLTASLNGVGVYQWFVQGYSADGFGAWGGPGVFSLSAAPPPMINKTSPGAGASLTTSNIPFVWQANASATSYELFVSGPNGWSDYRSWDAVTNCNASTCSISISVPSVGGYTWYLRGKNAAGFGPWGPNDAGGNLGARSFTVQIGVPGAVVPQSPVNTTVNTGQVAFSWQAVANATAYELYVAGPNSWVNFQTWPAATNCTPGCTVNLMLPSNGGYTWYLRASGPGGSGAWSSGAAFSVSATLPGAVTKQSPAQGGTVTTLAVALTWAKVANANAYEVFLSGPGGFVHFQQHVPGQSATCDASTCATTIYVPSQGSYQWYMRAWNPAGFGVWGPNQGSGDFDLRTFTVNPTAPTANPVLIAPANGSSVTASGAVRFEWSAASNATWYLVVLVSRNTGAIVSQTWVSGVNAGCGTGGTCGTSIAAVAGAYRWAVLTWGPGSVGVPVYQAGVTPTFTFDKLAS